MGDGDKSKELLSEGIYDPNDVVSRLRETGQYRNDFHSPELLKRYEQGKFSLWIKFRIGTVDTQEHYALFRHASGSVENLEDVIATTVNPSIGAIDCHSSAKCSGGNDEQQPMLVFNIRSMECPQNVSVQLPSVVGLYSLNEVLGDERNAVYLSTVTGVFEFLGRSGDGEPVIGANGVATSEHHTYDKVVKARPEMVDNFADDDRYFRIRGLIHRALPDICSAFTITLSDNTIRLRVSVEKAVTLNLEILDVLIGPLNFC